MNVIHLKYSTLFQLVIRNMFYKNTICARYPVQPEPDWELLPTTSTRRLMQRMDLVFRPVDSYGGCVVLARTHGKSGTNDILRYAVSHGDRFSFLIRLKKAAVLGFSNLPVPFPDEHILYFSNEQTDGTVARNNLHLSIAEAGVDGLNDVIKQSGVLYRYTHAGPAALDNTRVIHRASGKFVTPSSLINEGGKAYVLFNLNALPDGICKLMIDHADIDRFYYTGTADSRGIIGVVDLDLSASLTANYRIAEPDNLLRPERPMFVVRFPNRKTTWRYTVQMQASSPLYRQLKSLTAAEKAVFLNTLKLESNDPNVQFTRASADDYRIVYESTQQLALQEQYISSVVDDPLRINFNRYPTPGNAQAIKTDLPYPPVDLIHVVPPATIYSEILITI